MKKNFRFLICLATAAVAASCLGEKEMDNGPQAQLVPMTFSAVVDDIVDDTKTSLGTDFSVTWDEEESISLFSGSSHTELYKVSRTDDGKTATFEGLAEQTGVYHAVYPYSSEYSANADGAITVNLADSQPATADGFGHGVNLSAASSSSTDLQFRNVGALVGFTMGNDDIKSVVLTATEENQYLAGKSTLKFTDGLPEVTVTEGSASVRLNGDFEKGKTYYFVVYPGSYTNLKITYVDAEGKIASMSNPNTLDLARNGNATFGKMTMTEFTTINGVENLFIGGEGAEAGQKFTLITPSTYYNVNSNYKDLTGEMGNDTPYYEIYTRLEAGKKYYFYSEKPSLYIKANDFTVAANAEAASVTADATAEYRIRINPETKDVKMVKVNSVVLDNPWGEDKDGILEYKGRGVWGLSCFNIRLHVANWDHQRCDTRFKFYMTFDGVEGKQGFGAVADAGEAYWVQPTGGDDWSEWLFNFPGLVVDQNDENRYSADVNLYMNNDKGHYTHEFVNVVDNQISGPLYIGGEGAEAGQQFTYIYADYYKTDTGTYGDNFSMDMPYYEIHTQLKAGKDYYFYDVDSKISAAQVTEDGLYRIRINEKTRKVVTKKINRFYFLHLDMKYQEDFDYSGKGVWSKKFMMKVDDENGWRDDRYKFVLEFADGSIQHYGANHNDDNRYNNPKSAPEGYFDIQMTQTSEWDGKFKITDAFHRQNATITVYLNNEKGHYTHEFSTKAVFMGDSITEWWCSGDNANPSFFTENGYVCKGISGQTTSQMLERFDQDVVALAPECVVILAGTNDIARNEGYADTNEDILSNIASMASKAADAGIKVILCSILPCDYYSWRPEITGQATRIVEVNEMIRALAEQKGDTYVDYHSQMKTDDNALSGGYCTRADDRCHPNRAGYTVMEGIIKPVIESLVQ